MIWTVLEDQKFSNNTKPKSYGSLFKELFIKSIYSDINKQVYCAMIDGV